jgi:hypothetical protein
MGTWYGRLETCPTGAIGNGDSIAFAARLAYWPAETEWRAR